MKSVALRSVLCLLTITTIACEQRGELEGPLKHQMEIGDSDTAKMREQMVKLARAHVAKFEPDCRAEGVAIYPKGPGWGLIVDCIYGDSRSNVHLDADLFLKGDGSLYWKTEFAPRPSDSKPHEFVIEALPR